MWSMAEDTKARNVLRLWNDRNNVGTWPLNALGVMITSVSFIYGELRCSALQGEHLAGAERIHVADTPLTRALKEWTRQQVAELAEALHRAMMAEHKPRDRAQAAAALQNLRKLMRRYLDPDAAAFDDYDQEGARDKGTGDGKRRQHKGNKFGDRVDQLFLERPEAQLALAEGTAIPLVFRAVQISDDGREIPVRDVAVELVAEPAGLVELDQEGRLCGLEAGKGIMLLSANNDVLSNVVEFEVVKADGLDVLVPDDVLLQGQKLKLAITFRTREGPRDDLLIDATIDEPGMGLLGRAGRFTAGLKEGQATVRVRFGASPEQQAVGVLTIGPERVPITGQGGGEGSDIPEILLCGDEAPGMEEYEPSSRTHLGGENYPTGGDAALQGTTDHRRRPSVVRPDHQVPGQPGVRGAGTAHPARSPEVSRQSTR
jgi:hypothetical protein